MRLNVFARTESDLQVFWRRWRGIVAASAAGALVAAGSGYLFDPDRGRARRQRIRSRFAVRHSRRRSGRGLRVRAARACGQAHGLAHRLRHTAPAELDDAELAHKVESILFRDRAVPKGQISINAELGVVFVRGQVESQELIDEIQHEVLAVPGVHAVENLLHLPGTPAPHPRSGALLAESTRVDA
jgi:BON domain